MTTSSQTPAIATDESPETGPPGGDPLPGRRRRSTRESLPGLAVPILLVLTFVLFGILSPDLFLTWTNVKLTVSAQATVLLLAIAATIPLRTGDFDFSISAVMILSACMVGSLYDQGVSTPVAVLLALSVGLAVGLLNSLFIVVIGLDGLIVTLGVFTFIAGMTNLISGGNLVTTVPQGLQTFANHTFLSLPSVVWIGWLIALVIWFAFEFTPLGRYLLFIGGNRSAASLAGLRVNGLRAFSFVAASMIAAVAGVLLAGSYGSVDPSSSAAYLLAPFTAAFLGTTTIQMGRFNVVGTLVGLYLLAFGITGLQLLGSESWVTDAFNGAALVLALAFARYFQLLNGGRLRLRRAASS